MAKQKQNASKNDDKKQKAQAMGLNSLFQKTLNSIAYNVFNASNDNAEELQRINSEIQRVIDTEINDVQSITSDDMSTYLVKLFNDIDSNGKVIKGLDDIFANESAELFQFFQDRYKNKNLLYEDLEMITSQLFELDEAIMTTRDAIITADDITQTISRKISFKNSLNDSVGTSDEQYIKVIERLENDLRLPTKLKNLVIPYTLIFGTYYVYVCPYSKLFEQQYNHKLEDISMNSLSESVDDSFVASLKESLHLNDGKKISNAVKAYTDGIEIINDPDIYSIPLVEGMDLSDLVDNDEFRKQTHKITRMVEKQTSKYGADSTVDLTSKTKGMFDSCTGCYIKYISPKQIIPVKVLDTVIGYYYIHEPGYKVTRSLFSQSLQVSLNGMTTQDIENTFISSLSERIVKAFDKKYLENNQKFKDLILNALIYNDMYRKQIKFQFIPRDYMIEFKVNEDENGEGQSVLMRSLFYAKLYLALLVFKMISIITKSNDTKIYYVKNSGMDQNITNKVQEVARSVKGRQINFMDLLNYNSIISKIGANKEIFMPLGRSGERGIEFDILSGQDVQVNTDLMDMLRNNMINGTGVPSAIMNYVNEADYAKTLVMANAKFVGRVISYQIDLNPSITEMYRSIIRYSGINIPEEKINELIYTLNPPRSLNNINMSDMISNTDQIVSGMIKATTGETAEQTDDDNRIKDIMYNTLFRKLLPMLAWSDADIAYQNAKIKVASEHAEDNASKSNGEEQSY